MDSQRFEDVFSNVPLSANVKSNLKNTMVSRIKVRRREGTMEVHLISDTFVDERCLDDLRQDIIDFIPPINNVTAEICYPMEGLSDEEKIENFWPKLTDAVSEKNGILAGLIEKAHWYLEDSRLVIELANNTYRTLRILNIDKLIEDTLKSRLQLDVSVHFKDIPLDDEQKQQASERLRNCIEESTAPHVSVSESEDTVPERKVQSESRNTEKKKSAAAPVKKRRSSTKRAAEITGDPIPVSEALKRSDEVVIEGRVTLKPEIVTTKKGGYVVKTDIYDGTPLSLVFFCKPEIYEEEFSSVLVKGNYVKLRGIIQKNEYENNDPYIRVSAINPAQAPPVKQDNADVKRVELHLHTNMSMMDGINPASDYIKRASQWGHKAIAITDHGVVQAFPEAMETGREEGIKILYGCEGYLVNDMSAVVKRPKGQTFDDTFIVFDLETTGLDTKNDKIIEIGAVKIENREITDRFSTFVNPGEHIPDKITKLTGIYDDMVQNAPAEDEILPEFLEFIGDGVLAAHNAAFDVSFIKRFASERGIAFENTTIDTVELSKALLNGLANYRLDTVCNALSVSLENHHRAVDDAQATAMCFIKLMSMAEQAGEVNIDELNKLGIENIDKSKIRKRNHIIMFAKNQAGIKNIYQLVSDAHIKYYSKRASRPHFPKSEIMKYRDNLILGSACEAGELFEAVYNDMSDDDIKEIADFYDFFEIQPVGNNAFMIGNTRKNAKTVKSEEDIRNINRRIAELGEKFGKPVAATGDVHFMDPEGADFRRIIQSGEGFRLEEIEEQSPLYFRTTEEMLEEFSYFPPEKAYELVVTNTNLVADMIDDGIYAVPDRKCPPVIEGADEQLRQMTTRKAKDIYGDPLPEHIEKRLNKELDSIIGNGYAVLYIIAQKLVSDSNNHGYIVGSRGSVGSSFAATMAGITEVNPLDPHYVCPKCKYSDFTSEEVKKAAGNSGFDLPDRKCPHCGTEMNKDGQAIPFETFLGFNGDKEPDIDLNFSGEDQTRAHRYCEELFGEGHVFKAGTIATLQEKTVHGYVSGYCEQKGIHFTGAQRRYLVDGCVGVKRSTGQHPGGLVIVPDYTDIYEFCPVQYPANKADAGVKTTHFDYHSIDSCLLKLDMLGHDVPTILKMLHDMTGFDPLDVPMNDSKTMSLFTSPEALGVRTEDISCPTGTIGLPEFGTHFVIGMLMETKPETFSGLVKISGLSHGTDVWNGNAQELIANGTCDLNGVIPTRDDIMVYLIMHGLPDIDAFSIMENVRRGKGLTSDEEKLMREHDVPDWYIDSCKKIKYMFPKGHAVAYCTNTFRIGYFKINYPHEFYAAIFSVKYEDFDYSAMCTGEKTAREKYEQIQNLGKKASGKEKSLQEVLRIVIEMYARGIKFAPIDLYNSEMTKFTVIESEEGEKLILPPLCTIVGFGIAAAESLVNARAEGEFDTIENLRSRTNLGASNIQLLRDAGVLAGMRETDQLTLF